MCLLSPFQMVQCMLSLWGQQVWQSILWPKKRFLYQKPTDGIKSFWIQNIKLGSSFVSHLNKQEIKYYTVMSTSMLVIFQEYELDFKTNIRNGHILCFRCYTKVLYHGNCNAHAFSLSWQLVIYTILNKIINNISIYRKNNYRNY